jgi:RNA polymerase sigma factor (sigma-70 family)
MSLEAVTDGFLAMQAASGDGAAFAELARRYRPLILHVTSLRTLGVEVEDARQVALVGLFQACRHYQPGRGRFEGLASLRVRSVVRNARIEARTRKHRVLTEAFRDDDEPMRQLEQRAVACEGWDPALVVELRDELREHARRTRRRSDFPGRDLRRRYTDEQKARALALIAEGRTIKEVAFAVGASTYSVARWVKRSGQPRAGRRRYTQREVSEVVALVRSGASLRKAGATVGASNAAVLRWVRRAA